jgi:hypothetical protein
MRFLVPRPTPSVLVTLEGHYSLATVLQIPHETFLDSLKFNQLLSDVVAMSLLSIRKSFTANLERRRIVLVLIDKST